MQQRTRRKHSAGDGCPSRGARRPRGTGFTLAARRSVLGQRAWLAPPDACSGPGPVPSPVSRWGVQPCGPEGQPPSFISWREERGAGGPPPTHLGAGDPVPSTVWLREPPPMGFGTGTHTVPRVRRAGGPGLPSSRPQLPCHSHHTGSKEPSCARTARTRRRPCRGAQGRQGQDRHLRPHRASASAPGASAPGCVLSSLTLWPSRSGRQSSILSPIRLGCGQHLWQIWAAGTWLGRMDSPAAPARGPGPPAALRPPADRLSTPPCHRHHAQCQHRGHWEEQQTP